MIVYIAYILAQVLGGLVGASLIYGIYFGAIEIYEGAGVRTQATAGIFATYSVSARSSASYDAVRDNLQGILATVYDIGCGFFFRIFGNCYPFDGCASAHGSTKRHHLARAVSYHSIYIVCGVWRIFGNADG